MTFSSSTDSIIQILPEPLINKIAAGEVVERPASVVKELLENAIDAGATEVQVNLINGGKDLISILDNGCGMSESDAQLAVERHATSKIYNEDDLFRINTLGFRGEALASIASVSHFELLTCNDENQGGTRMIIKGGNFEPLSKTGFPKGTKVTVERLFFNTPARLKFLKTTSTELQHIQNHILQKSLANPDIHFRLTHNRQLLLNLTSGKGLQTRIQQIFGEEFLDTIFPVKHKETTLSFSGFISHASKPRKSKRWQYIFVNNRNVKSPAINHGIYDGYGVFMGKSQHPAFFLNIELDPTEIDVNVHPAKTEIRFRNSQLVHTILADQISIALKESASHRFFGREHSLSQMYYTGVSGQIEIPMEELLPLEGEKSKDKLESKKSRFKIEARDSPPKGSLRKSKSAKKTFHNQETVSANSTLSESKAESSISKLKSLQLESSLEKDSFASKNKIRNFSLISPLPEIPKNVRVLGQFRKNYIIAENDDGIVVIEQCSLHKRLLYDKFIEALKKKEIPVETLKVSLLLELTPHESVIIEQYLEALSISGFAVSPFGGSTFAINSIPKFVFENQVKKVISKILDRAAHFGKGVHDEEIIRSITLTVAEFASIKPEQILEIKEMEFLLAQWEAMGSPLLNLQNRPFLIEISLQDVEKRLRLL